MIEILSDYHGNYLQALIVVGQLILSIAFLGWVILCRVSVPTWYWPCLRVGICLSFLMGIANCGGYGLVWANSPGLPGSSEVSYHTVCWFAILALLCFVKTPQRLPLPALYAGCFLSLIIPDFIFGFQYAAALGVPPQAYRYVLIDGLGGGQALDALALVPIGVTVYWCLLNRLAGSAGLQVDKEVRFQ